MIYIRFPAKIFIVSTIIWGHCKSKIWEPTLKQAVHVHRKSCINAREKMAWRGGPAGGRESAKERGTPFGGVCLAHTHVAEEICRLKKCEEIRVRRKERQGGEER